MKVASDLVRMPDGTEYRSELRPDRDYGDNPPDDEGAWPTLCLAYIHGPGTWHAERVGYEVGGDACYAEAFNRFAKGAEWIDRDDLFERWLKVFHGVTTVRWYRGQHRTYVAFDTPEWRDKMGIERDKDLSGEDPLAEWQAWSEGDVWGVVIRTRWNPDNNLSVVKGWEDVPGTGTVWGLYGLKYAKVSAAEYLDDAVVSHKVVYRYPEHEKLAALSVQVDAVLGYLNAQKVDGNVPEGIAALPEKYRERAEEVKLAMHEQWVYAHFGIDYKAIKVERALMTARAEVTESA